MTIINDNSRVVNKLEASLTDEDRVIIYDHHMFIVQAPDPFRIENIIHLFYTTSYLNEEVPQLVFPAVSILYNFNASGEGT